MGKNNKQRRAAKKRRQRAAGAQQRRRDGQQRGWRPPSAADLVHTALWAYHADRAGYDQVARDLAAHGEEAVRAVGDLTATILGALWDQGWTPADLMHVIGRQLSPRHADATADAVLADGRRHVREGRTLHPRWQAQLSALETERNAVLITVGPRLGVALEVLCVLAHLAPVTRTVPRPGAEAQFDPGGDHGLDARVLARVRALLAKAESTEFDEEAEALTAKAQELIARHAITEALVHAADDVGEPLARRILLDDPYADAKASLASEVSLANRCRAVHIGAYGWVTVFGFAHDLDAVELLSASLLVQATGAMTRQGSRRDAHGRSTTRSFRRAFLFGFAHRIGERLRQANDQEMSATADSDQQRLLPVLSARDDRVRDAQLTAFPNSVQRQRSISNGGGWVAGQAAADLADLTVSAGALRSTGK
jgi:hypothetical protein